MSEELTRQRLYRIFRLEEENYITTMKVMYIYRWVNKRAPDCTYDVITDLRRIYKLRKNTDRVDMIFRHMQAVNSAHLAAPASARPPQQQSKYYAGWKIG